jgi:hypothetical protein
MHFQLRGPEAPHLAEEWRAFNFNGQDPGAQ